MRLRSGQIDRRLATFALPGERFLAAASAAAKRVWPVAVSACIAAELSITTASGRPRLIKIRARHREHREAEHQQFEKKRPGEARPSAETLPAHHMQRAERDHAGNGRLARTLAREIGENQQRNDREKVDAPGSSQPMMFSQPMRILRSGMSQRIAQLGGLTRQSKVRDRAQEELLETGVGGIESVVKAVAEAEDLDLARQPQQRLAILFALAIADRDAHPLAAFGVHHLDVAVEALALEFKAARDT